MQNLNDRSNLIAITKLACMIRNVSVEMQKYLTSFSKLEAAMLSEHTSLMFCCKFSHVQSHQISLKLVTFYLVIVKRKGVPIF